MERCKSVVEAVQSACGGVRAHCTCVLSKSPAPVASGRIRGRAGPPALQDPRSGAGCLQWVCNAASAPCRWLTALHPGLPHAAATSQPSQLNIHPCPVCWWRGGWGRLGDHRAVTLCSSTPRACRVRAVASPARCPSRGDARPVGPWGGTSRASRRYALVPEPKIAGDAR